MFRIVCNPSSGSVERAWLKLLVIFFVCVVGVWQRDFEPAVCVPGTSSLELVVPGTHTAGSKSRCQTPTTHTKNITSNFSQARSTLPDDGSLTIRNMSEWFLIVFKIDKTWILTFEFYTIECISRPIKVIDFKYERWKPEIKLLHVSVQSQSSGSVLFELAKVIVIKIIS